MWLGPSFFSRRYNIGFWAWELTRWPEEWIAAIATVDEIWAPSRFVRDSLAKVTRKPVEWMPECIQLGEVQRVPRSEFGMGSDDFVFAFAFDGYSYLERKNPVAVVRAFRKAFVQRERAKLIVKVMNSQVCGTGWNAVMAEASQDERITVVDASWPHAKLISMMNCADVYVSLHRSEGFGRTPAEAMLLGKPVIVTDYSGTVDFCRPDNALLVDYRLVPVAERSYVATAGQVWADPDVDCAARHMRALFDDRSLGPRIGASGRQTILNEFSAAAVGSRYRDRLLELGLI
jgi:glycosyltransferase involved in cell wall biosynthesis